MLANQFVHVGGREMLEARPAIVRVGTRRKAMVIIAFGKQPPLDGLLQPSGFQLFERLQLVQPLDEKQISDLLDDFQRIGNPAGPERIPDLIDLITNFVGKHENLERSLLTAASSSAAIIRTQIFVTLLESRGR